MENTAKAYEEIARTTGGAHIAPDGKGWVEMQLPDDQSLFIEEVDEHTLEISARIVGDIGSQTNDQLYAILKWNTANAPMRIAIESGTQAVVGQRVDVRDVDAVELKACIGKVVLASNDLAESLSGPASPGNSSALAAEDGFNLIRI